MAFSFEKTNSLTLDPSGVSLEDSKTGSGQHCVHLTKTPAHNSIVALRQRFDAEPDKWYRAKVRYKARIKTGCVTLIFAAFDKRVKGFQKHPTDYIFGEELALES